MSENQPPITPEEEREIRETLRQLSVPKARPEFRAKMKSQFTEAGSPDVYPMTSSNTASDRGFKRGLVWGGLAAAAALALFLFTQPASSPSWTASVTNGPSELVVDGETIHTADSQTLGANATVYNPGPNALVIGIEDVIQCVLAPNTEIVLGTTTKDGKSELSATLDQGQMMAVTGPEFPGLTLTTEEAEIRITGTLFGMLKEADSTCVCVFEGKVLAKLNGELITIPEESRLTLFSNQDPIPMSLYPLSLKEEEMKGMLASR
ncbi:MAG: hypothetical protein HKN21_14765 [Candidatus Eisenbacteria bacterium]|uniref:FecR protein domain-containing protein n=1 Tax=Eiseniibacteriota bacterium TaxID=2212470 RepID=A0A7Y2EGP1_UNCEI|nr:hypothetical protein [Candidatus Eisenbacteria bacterium]